LTNNVVDFVPSSVIMSWLADNHLRGIKLFTLELKEVAQIRHFDKISSDANRVTEKVVQVWFGIKKL